MLCNKPLLRYQYSNAPKERRRVTYKPIATNKQSSLTHFGGDVDDVAGDADARSCTGIGSFVVACMPFRPRDVVQERSIEKHL